MKATLRLIFFILIYYNVSAVTFASDTIQLIPENFGVPLGTKISFIEDPNEKIKVQQLFAGTLNDQLTPCTNQIPNWGWIQTTIWIKLTLSNPDTSKKKIILESHYAFNNELSSYQQKNGKITSSKSGISYPFHIRELKYGNPVFQYNLGPLETKTIFLKAQSDGKSLLLPLKIFPLSTYHQKDHHTQLIYGIYYGLTFVICIINCFFLITTRNKTYLYYIIYVIFFALIQASYDGSAFQYLWPESPWFHNRSIPFFGWIATIAVTLFSMHFLELKKWFPAWNKFFQYFLYLVAPTVILLVFNPPFIVAGAFIINILAVAGFIPIFIVAVKSIRARFYGARFFLAAFVFLLFGLVIFTGANAGVISNDYLVMYGMKFGSAVEAIILSFSLAVRFKAMKDQKEEAQKQQLRRLEEMNKLKDQMNIELEQKVKERTHELAEKNKEITASITYAKRIQEAILPPDKLIWQYLPESFVLYLPKDIVAGDFYWLEQKDEYVFFAAADCTGHGVPGAMVSVVCHNALNRAVREFDLKKPGLILDKVRSLVIETFEKSERDVKDGMDISLCVLNKENQTLLYGGANNPLYIVRNKTSIDIIKADKQPIGNTDHPVPFTTHEINVQPEDQLFLFSDGYADQFGGSKGKKLGYKRFREMLLEISTLDMNMQQDKLLTYFNEWKKEEEQIDDVCVMGVRLIKQKKALERAFK